MARIDYGSMALLMDRAQAAHDRLVSTAPKAADLEDLASLDAVRRAVDQLIEAVVRDARRPVAGGVPAMTWDEIAYALQLRSRQAAQQRYGIS